MDFPRDLGIPNLPRKPERVLGLLVPRVLLSLFHNSTLAPVVDPLIHEEALRHGPGEVGGISIPWQLWDAIVMEEFYTAAR